MDRIYDIAIIGGGPAGYSAALYASRAGFDTVVIEKMTAGGQMTLTGDIDNYPGFDSGIDGFSLGMQMQNGAHRFGAQTVFAEVTEVQLTGNIKKLITTSQEILCRAVIIATGANPKELGLDGERELTGRGVHYCAHCDGRFYKDKTVVVIGGGNSAVGDALYLSRIAKKVYLVHRRDVLRATKIYDGQLSAQSNIEICYNSIPTKLIADKKVTGLIISDVHNGTQREIECNGVFISIGRKPITEFLVGQLKIDNSGYIIADETTKTNIEGVFAAGDVRTKALRQVVTAAADGAVAVHYAEEYLSEEKK